MLATLTLQSRFIVTEATEKYFSEKEDLRLLLKQIYKTEASLIADEKNQ